MSRAVGGRIVLLALAGGACASGGETRSDHEPARVERTPAPAAPAEQPVSPAAETVDVPSPTRVGFEPFGPTPGTTEEQLEAWTALVRERFLADPDDERLAELDRQLSELDIVDATPAFINAVRGLDMAKGLDVVRCAALVDHWYVAQAKFQQIHVNGDGTKTDARHSRSRLTALDGWVRWWTRKLANEGSLDRYRLRVETLLADLERIRRERRSIR